MKKYSLYSLMSQIEFFRKCGPVYKSGATIIRYVDTECKSNFQDGRDWEGAFPSLQQALNNQQQDLVSQGKSLYIYCRGLQPNNPININGWKTNPDCNITIDGARIKSDFGVPCIDMGNNHMTVRRCIIDGGISV